MNKRAWNVIKLNVVLTFGMEMAKAVADKVSAYFWPAKTKIDDKVKWLKKEVKLQKKAIQYLDTKVQEVTQASNSLASTLSRLTKQPLVDMSTGKEIEDVEEPEEEDEEVEEE